MAGAKFTSTDKAFSESEKAISSELKCAYPDNAGIESYVRRVSLSGGTVTVTEDIKLDSKKEIDFHLMLSKKPELLENGKIALPEGRTLRYDTSLTAELEEFDPVGMDTKSAWDTEVLYRLHFRINTDKCNVTFTIE